MSGTGHILNDSVRPVAKVNGMPMHANRELLTGSLGLIREHRNIWTVLYKSYGLKWTVLFNHTCLVWDRVILKIARLDDVDLGPAAGALRGAFGFGDGLCASDAGDVSGVAGCTHGSVALSLCATSSTSYQIH
jgi:hypothetical protein